MDYLCEPCGKVFNGAKPHQDHLNSEKHKKTINEKAYSGSTPVYSSNCLQQIEDPYVKQCGIGYKCILCNMVLNSPQQALSHINGKSHSNLSRKKQSSHSGSLPSNNIVSNPSNTKVLALDSYIKQCENQYKCTLCDTVLNSAQQVQSHITGKYHLSKKSSNYTGAVSSSAGSILPEDEVTTNFSFPMESHSGSLPSNNIVSNPSNTKVLALDSYIKQYENQYKCTLCDIVLNSAQQVQSHITGKYHLSKTLSNYTGAVSSSAGSILPEDEFTTNISLPMEINSVLENIKVFNIDEPVCF